MRSALFWIYRSVEWQFLFGPGDRLSVPSSAVKPSMNCLTHVDWIGFPETSVRTTNTRCVNSKKSQNCLIDYRERHSRVWHWKVDLYWPNFTADLVSTQTNMYFGHQNHSRCSQNSPWRISLRMLWLMLSTSTRPVPTVMSYVSTGITL